MNVVFDTNAYYGLAHGRSRTDISTRARRMRNCEMSGGVHAFAHPIVMLELLARLVGGSDLDRERYTRAISLLVSHCQHWTEDDCLAMIATSEMQILGMLFGEVPCGLEESVHVTRIICQKLAHVYMSTGDAAAARKVCGSDDLAFIASQVRQQEERYKQLWDHATGQRTRPTKAFLESEAFLRLLASCWVMRAALQAAKELTQAQMIAHTDLVARHLRAPLCIHSELCIRSLAEGFRLDSPKKNRVNTIWDIDIASVVGLDHIVDDRPIVLVTDEKMITGACEHAGCGEYVMSRAAYLRAIGYRSGRI